MKSYFSDDELKCRCCGKLIIDEEFREQLNLARGIAGFPFIVDSGYRCEKHNTDVGSTSTNHTSGKAADIACDNANLKYDMVKALIRAGLKGIGIAKTFVHCDTNRIIPSIWIY